MLLNVALSLQALPLLRLPAALVFTFSGRASSSSESLTSMHTAMFLAWGRTDRTEAVSCGPRWGSAPWGHQEESPGPRWGSAPWGHQEEPPGDTADLQQNGTQEPTALCRLIYGQSRRFLFTNGVYEHVTLFYIGTKCNH